MTPTQVARVAAPPAAGSAMLESGWAHDRACAQGAAMPGNIACGFYGCRAALSFLLYM